ncbi:alpha/beta hydrolase [Humisphaera borealis]|uniref:Alpha/beta hydrolase n=1 Tax=Humisphaera borealis TaxID=2807512 RepID=A0A7M2WZB4_9BACT|nr:alpha/beta hydrolase [Humisphaera borealis]
MHSRLLILHGYGDHSGRFAHVMQWFAERGVACEAFDFRGHGRSSGRRGYVSRWQEFLDDLKSMLSASHQNAGRDGYLGRPMFVLGHSHGGLVAATAGTDGVLNPPEIAGVILTAPYLRPATSLGPLWTAIAAVTNILAPSLRVGSGLSADMMTSDAGMIEDSRNDTLLLRAATPRWYATTLRRQQQTSANAARFKLPLLCLHGDADRVADASAAKAFVEGTSNPDRSFVLLAGQKHEILREVNREASFERIFDWMRRSSQVAVTGI